MKNLNLFVLITLITVSPKNAFAVFCQADPQCPSGIACLYHPWSTGFECAPPKPKLNFRGHFIYNGQIHTGIVSINTTPMTRGCLLSLTGTITSPVGAQLQVVGQRNNCNGLKSENYSVIVKGQPLALFKDTP